MFERFAPRITHVDDWIETHSISTDKSLRYAAWALYMLRLPKWAHEAFEQWLSLYPLHCTYEGIRYRVVETQRNGRIGLSRELAGGSYDLTSPEPDEAKGREIIYADIAKCGHWSNLPARYVDIDLIRSPVVGAAQAEQYGVRPATRPPRMEETRAQQSSPAPRGEALGEGARATIRRVFARRAAFRRQRSS